MAEKSFKKIRCVHAVKNSIHFIPEHLITDEYLKDNQFIVQEFEVKNTEIVEAVGVQMVKAPKTKLKK